MFYKLLIDGEFMGEIHARTLYAAAYDVARALEALGYEYVRLCFETAKSIVMKMQSEYDVVVYVDHESQTVFVQEW